MLIIRETSVLSDGTPRRAGNQHMPTPPPRDGALQLWNCGSLWCCGKFTLCNFPRGTTAVIRRGVTAVIHQGTTAVIHQGTTSVIRLGVTSATAVIRVNKRLPPTTTVLKCDDAGDTAPV